MLKEVVKISNLHGIHARPAGVLAKACAQYQSRIEMIYDGKTIKGKKHHEYSGGRDQRPRIA